ncbi:MAG: hypothetical protein ACOX9E_14905 [Lentisphaeria bacterium]|jgi:hypothetical protein
MKKMIKKLKNQRGSALLLTLGILSLALIMAMSFAFSARTTRQVAKINADQVKARLLAESGLERVLAAMQYNWDPSTGAYPPAVSSGNFSFTSARLHDRDTPTTPNSLSGYSQRYLVSSGGSGVWDDFPFNDVPALSHFTFDSSQPTTHDQYPTYLTVDTVIGQDGGGADIREVIGRMAFIVLEEANKLDINEMLTLQYQYPTSSPNPRICEFAYAPFVKHGEPRLANLFTDTFFAAAPPPPPAIDHDFFYDIYGGGVFGGISPITYPPPPSDPFDDRSFEELTVRLGLNMREIRVPLHYFFALDIGYFFPPPPHTSPPLFATRTKWFSNAHLCNRLGDYETSPSPSAMWWNPAATQPRYHCDRENNFLYYDCLTYTFFSGEDIEAYWDGTTERQRFDITGYEWRDPTAGSFYNQVASNPSTYEMNPTQSGWHHGGTLVGAQALVEALVADSDRAVFYEDRQADRLEDVPSIGDTGFGIPHLRTIENATTNQGRQIAANMVDFCDEDHIATTESGWETLAGALSQSSAPAYFGNEKVPYFNEFALSFIAYKELNTSTSMYEYSIKFSPFLEVVNVFGEDIIDASFTIDISASVTCSDSTITPVKHADFVPISGTVSGDVGDFVSGYQVSYNLTEKNVINPIYSAANDLGFTITISKIVLVMHNGSGNEVYDLAYLPLGEPDVVFSDINSGDVLSACWEVYDPRFNHPPSEWVMNQSPMTASPPTPPKWEKQHWIEGDGVPSIDTTPGVVGARNRYSNPNPDDSTYRCDHEDYSTIVFSTAFIPNQPFRSLWELGAIHRGERFRTINLTAYRDPAIPAGDHPPPGSYVGGDAEILDQVKIGPLKRTRGKFNLNSNNPAATSVVAASTIGTLLSNIDVTVGYEGVSNAESNTVFTAPSLAAPSFSRGECATVLHYNTGTTDRQREALIGRTANLLTTRVDKYTVLVVGQALKELEGVTSTTWPQVQQTAINPIEYPAGSNNYYSILSTQRLLAHIVRDAWRNEYKVVQMQLLED